MIKPQVQGPGVTTIVCSYIDIKAFTSLTSNMSQIERKKSILWACIPSLEYVE